MPHPHTVVPMAPTNPLIGESPLMHTLRAQIRHLIVFDVVGKAEVPTILLQGETCTGKSLVAQLIHDSGPRAQCPFIEVNCAAIPDALLEAEIFGYEAGAFSDAKRPKPGLFEAASSGTLFLDEVQALPLALQGKLLTALEGKWVRRLGAVTERTVDVKIIAATQMALSALVTAGRFRAELYYRLAVIVLELPPLRARREDLLPLAQHFLRRYAEVHGVAAKRLSAAAAAWLRGHDWPGNVRELSHLLERVTLLSAEAIIDPDMLARLSLPRMMAPPPQYRCLPRLRRVAGRGRPDPAGASADGRQCPAGRAAVRTEPQYLPLPYDPSWTEFPKEGRGARGTHRFLRRGDVPAGAWLTRSPRRAAPRPPPTSEQKRVVVRLLEYARPGEVSGRPDWDCWSWAGVSCQVRGLQ